MIKDNTLIITQNYGLHGRTIVIKEVKSLLVKVSEVIGLADIVYTSRQVEASAKLHLISDNGGILTMWGKQMRVFRLIKYS